MKIISKGLKDINNRCIFSGRLIEDDKSFEKLYSQAEQKSKELNNKEKNEKGQIYIQGFGRCK